MHAGLKAVLYAAGLLAAVTYPCALQAQARISIQSPAPEQVLRGPDVTVRFHVNGATLAPGGTNVHFMLDNEPFEVQFDESHPHVFKDVAPGTHTVRAFVANAMHEAIRGSMDMVTFSVGYPDATNRQCPGVPTLTYNLPQGEYMGIDAADVTLDYLISNVSLAPGANKVAYYVDGRRFFVEDQMPRHLKGLRPGYHVVRIELQDEYGDLIAGPFNSVERTILLSPDKSTNSAGVLASKYPGSLPRVNSIRGAMTMGRPWTAVEKPRPMTREQVRQSQKLTVRHGGTVVAESSQATEAETTTDHTSTVDVTEAPEVTSRETHTRTTVTERNEASPEEAKAEAGPVNGITSETRTTAETRLTTSGKRLDDRLQRVVEAPETATLRSDAPTTSGRSAVRRVKVANTSTTGTVANGISGNQSTSGSITATMASTPPPSPAVAAGQTPAMVSPAVQSSTATNVLPGISAGTATLASGTSATVTSAAAASTPATSATPTTGTAGVQ